MANRIAASAFQIAHTAIIAVFWDNYAQSLRIVIPKNRSRAEEPSANFHKESDVDL